MPGIVTLSPSGDTSGATDTPAINAAFSFTDTDISVQLGPGDWYTLLNAPILNARGAVRLLAACAEHVGDPSPPDGYLTGGNILEVFTRIDDDRPVEDSDGIPVVDPKADADVPATI